MSKRKRPQYIIKMLKDINADLRARKLKYEDHYEDSLFQWCVSYLLHNHMYNGFNMYYDKKDKYGNVVSVLAGPNYDEYDYYLQIW